MDLITQTSLEALLLKATSSQNQNIDTAAVEAFCALINKEKDGAHIGVKVLANRLPCGCEKELLQTLNLLDICMSRCGSQFQSEVGKFRFLNEMIKLVSPKYLGSQTPLLVKQKVLQLMYIWTLDYPRESKIKEAYDMLRKQGVIREIPNPNIVIQSTELSRKRNLNSIFQDEEKSKILQKLLQSKDPEDIQAANWLIKSMVKEDDKRAELRSKKVSEVESVQNNVRLLNEMLDSYKPGASSADELDLIKELHQCCERLRPNLMTLANETQHNGDVLSDILQAADDLDQVFNKYKTVIVAGSTRPGHDDGNPLLDFECTNSTLSEDIKLANFESKTHSEMDVLCDIFNSSNIPDPAAVLKPMAVLTCDTQNETRPKDGENDRFRALEDLDVLSEHLLKENLQSTRQSTFNKNHSKTPLNLLSKLSENKVIPQNKMPLSDPNESLHLKIDFSYLIDKEKPKTPSSSSDNNTDDCLVDIADEKMLEADGVVDTLNGVPDTSCRTQDIKLNEIFIKLEEIKPSTLPPLTLLSNRNGLAITLHYVKDKPRSDVNVFVLTTISRSELAVSNYLFQAVVPQGCKLKLQPPSTTVLPAFNAFLPPSAITQIMLISAGDGLKVFLKFIVSFVMDDETCTEMGEVDDLNFN